WLRDAVTFTPPAGWAPVGQNHSWRVFAAPGCV
ncbi:MAG: hypothetical protein QOI80_856, partial [Solirubrobacteraceae bacterium]|nr:hypothetical protein [Solirubrobacteraceae bacterium]